jgi:hypothetical protein
MLYIREGTRLAAGLDEQIVGSEAITPHCKKKNYRCEDAQVLSHERAHAKSGSFPAQTGCQ